MKPNDKKKVLITTAIDYTNAVIHIGQAYEKILADSVARFYRLSKGSGNVLFLTGTDEHGTTNEKAAKERGITTKDHVDEISKKDQEQINSLNISYDRFIRTTDDDHKELAKEIFAEVLKSGKIYKAKYKGLYCEGCEAYKTLNELNENGQCPLHTTRQIQEYDEENYFFTWSKYAELLKDLIEKNKLLVLPKGKRNEMLAFVKQGIKDIPITRPKFKLPWGITTPNDDEQVIYVWFDALINYITGSIKKGFWNDDTYIIHFVGKDVARWHTLLWPAMLASTKYKLPDVVYVHGFLNINNDKISKSKGNVLYAKELADKYGTDAIRYYFLKHGPITEDTNVSLDHLREVYNADLANGLGNTVARIAKLAEKSDFEFEPLKISTDIWAASWAKPLREFRVDVALQNIWKRLGDLDKHINENEPWTITDTKKLKKILQYEIDELRKIVTILEPFLPETAQKIQQQFKGPKIKAQKPLFPRI